MRLTRLLKVRKPLVDLAPQLGPLSKLVLRRRAGKLGLVLEHLRAEPLLVPLRGAEEHRAVRRKGRFLEDALADPGDDLRQEHDEEYEDGEVEVRHRVEV